MVEIEHYVGHNFVMEYLIVVIVSMKKDIFVVSFYSLYSFIENLEF